MERRRVLKKVEKTESERKAAENKVVGVSRKKRMTKKKRGEEIKVEGVTGGKRVAKKGGEGGRSELKGRGW